ncbi:hypothetical protein RHGRI_012354 [Rhododendron griersonianum]|uniref:Alpha/beta hydrolase fold-3 domain-containing protein n=1 Tax=Rhododendron griersonianum TaxID=479676 RepID=A0AAV6KQS3_9ERIC|nr:hypothetical protein RHGRI_012354 [Rhododendron griersonianum]
MVSDAKTIASELVPILRVYQDGTVERLVGSPFVPPTLEDPSTGVSSKDTTISPPVSARLYLPKLSPPANQQKLPILVYFHGGGFCIESAFSSLYHDSMNSLVSRAKVIVVSVEYRLAPEHPVQAAYEDSWTALQWVASHFLEDTVDKDPWLIGNGDFDRVYVGGDSAGANIAHNLTIRAGTEGLFGGVKILGAFLAHPYFWGSDPIGSESVSAHEENLLHRTWAFVYPAPGGMDHPMINPFARDAPSLSGIGCSRLLVCVAGTDDLRERGIRYAEVVRESGWGGDLELFEVEGEGHCFHILNPGSDSAKNMVNRLASFLK